MKRSKTKMRFLCLISFILVTINISFADLGNDPRLDETFKAEAADIDLREEDPTETLPEEKTIKKEPIILKQFKFDKQSDTNKTLFRNYYTNETIPMKLPSEVEFDVGEPLIIGRRQSGVSQLQTNPNNSMMMGKYPIGSYVHFESSTVSTPSHIWPPDSLEPDPDPFTSHSFASTKSTKPSTLSSLTTPSIPIVINDTEPPFRILPKSQIKASNLFSYCGSKEKNGKTCFAYPMNCIESQTCRIAVAISSLPWNPLWIKIEMAATAPHGFAAIGFSEDRFMGDDIIAYCAHVPNGSEVTLHLSQNIGYESIMQTNIGNFKKQFNLIGGLVQNSGVLGCEFEMDTEIFLDNPKKKFNLANKTMHLFLAFGRHDDTLEVNDTDYGALLFHHMAIVSDEQINLNGLENNPRILFPRDRSYLMLHIIPNILAFSFFHPCAIFMAKYGREAYGDLATKAKIPLWNLIHMIFHAISIFLSILGYLGTLIELGGFWRSVTSKAIFHSVFGTIGILFLWGNAIYGAINFGIQGETVKTKFPKNLSSYEVKNLKSNKWNHWFFGNIVYICGMGALFISPFARRAHAPCLLTYVVSLQIFVHFTTHIFMSFHTYWLVFYLDGKQMLRRIFPGPMITWFVEDLGNLEEDVEVSDMDVWAGRRRAVKFYFITSAICCLGMIILMYVPLVLCRQSVEVKANNTEIPINN